MDRMAIKVYNALANGMGGLDWAGLDYQVAYFEISDVDGLIQRLHVIKSHKAPEES